MFDSSFNSINFFLLSTVVVLEEGGLEPLMALSKTGSAARVTYCSSILIRYQLLAQRSDSFDSLASLTT